MKSDDTSVFVLHFKDLLRYNYRARTDDLLITNDNATAFLGQIHAHDYFELEYVMSGSGIQLINGYSYPVKKGDLIFFSLEDRHAYYSVDNLKISNLCLRVEFMNSLKFKGEDCRNASVFHLTDEMSERVETVMRYLISECTEKNDLYRESIRHYVELFMILLKRIGNIRSEDRNRWEHVFSYLNDSYPTATLEEAAKILCVSKNYFCTLFRQKTGGTFYEYLTNLRINAAKELLSYTGMPIGDIWKSVGFPQAKQFNRAFLLAVGCTPMKFRSNQLS